MLAFPKFKKYSRLMIASTVCAVAFSGLSYADEKLTTNNIDEFYKYSERITLIGGNEVVEYIKKHLHEDAKIKQQVEITLPGGQKKSVTLVQSKQEFLKESVNNFQKNASKTLSVETTIVQADIASDGQSAHVKTSNKIEALNNVPTAQGKMQFKSDLTAECEDTITLDDVIGVVITESSCVSEITMTPAQ